MIAQTTIQALDEGTVGIIFQSLLPKTRVEREHPHRPEHLHVDVEDFNASFITWHLRDTSRLQEVRSLKKELKEYPWQVKTDKEPPRWMGRVLTLIGALTHLETLVLKNWKYCATDIDSLSHLTRLQNLKALELFWADYSGEEAENIDHGMQHRNRAALQFQGVILALQLTSLSVINVDFVADDCDQILPERDAGSLAELRSLIYREEGRDLCFPCVRELVGLTRLELSVCADEALPHMLTSLCKLEELSISNAGPLPPLVINSAAEMTRLSLNAYLIAERPLSSIQPLKTLEKIIDLILILMCTEDEPQWPDTWDQLTSITRLKLGIRPEAKSGTSLLLPSRIKNLIDLEVTVQYSSFHTFGEIVLNSLIGDLPALSRLQVNIEGIKSVNGSLDREGQFRETDLLDAICMALQIKRQGLEYILTEVKGAWPSTEHVQLIFTM